LQDVWGYSALKTGVAFLPMVGLILVACAAAEKLVTRIGAEPLLLAGSPIAAAGLFWLTRLHAQDSYSSAVLGPMLVIGLGLGLLFVPMALVALEHVAEDDDGIASSLLNTGRQVGGSVGLAVLGTVAWSRVASSLRTGASPGPAMATGFSRAYLVCAMIALLALLITVVLIRVRREDLE
jgi:hypothetical protein